MHALLERHAGDGVALAHVRWASGLALRELGELSAAREELAAAEAQARSSGDERTAAAVRSSLAVALLHLGETERALTVTETAARDLDGAEGARNEMQRGVILQRLGRHDEAVEAYGAARPQLREAGDEAAEARLLSNRGVLYAYRGELGAAEADLTRSVTLARGLDNVRATALGLQNLGFVMGRQGRLADALARLEEADELLRELGDDAALAVLDADRAAVLAEAGLLDEALERAEAAAVALRDDEVDGAEADLTVARLCLLTGRRERALRLADRLRQRFRTGGRVGWELHARYVALAARAERAAGGQAEPDTPIGATAADRLADDLETGGWATEARAARLVAARWAVAEGRPGTARRVLEKVRGTPRDAPTLDRAQHWYATALLRIEEGDRTGARRAVAAGLGLLERSRLVFASAELRAHAVRHAGDLVDLAVRLALEDDRPAEALRAVERVRATDVAVPPRPPADEQLAADLTRLRELDQQAREAARAARTLDPATERARLERRVRDRARTVVHEESAEPELRLDVASLRRMLAGRTLATYVQTEGELHLLAVTPRTTRHRRLGAVEPAREALDHLRAALRRLASGQGSVAAMAAAEASLDRSAADLTEQLGLADLDPEGLVVVPASPLEGLPWTALSRVTGHVPVVAPSAGAWASAARRRVSSGPLVLAAGPGLPGARAEIEALAERQPGATTLTGRDATVAAVLEAMQRAGTAHLATHGRFRGDNPLFSALELADGALTVYELEGSPRLPSLLILSSCEAAAVSTPGEHAVLGLSSVLLRLGVRCLVAPVVEIPDEATAPLMLGLHERLAAGLAPHRALDETLLDAPLTGPTDLAARTAFVVVGASDPVPNGARW
jgi:tetratricopeptide (TPR) repeat protein